VAGVSIGATIAACVALIAEESATLDFFGIAFLPYPVEARALQPVA
jgi:hypothetical protein